MVGNFLEGNKRLGFVDQVGFQSGILLNKEIK